MFDKNRLDNLLSTLQTALIQYPRFLHIVGRVDRLVSSPIHRGIILHGPSKVGKTSIAETLIEKHPHVYDGGVLVRAPVVFAKIGPVPTVKTIYEALLPRLDWEIPVTGREADLRRVFIKEARRLDVRLIFMDEFQHFIPNSASPTISRAGDGVKILMDEAGISICLLGLGRSEKILRKNSQLRSRFGSSIELCQFKLDDEVDFLVFRSILSEFEELLSVKFEPRLHDPEVAARIWYATGGRIGYVKLLLTGALEHAAMHGVDNLTGECLSAGFREEIWRGGSGSRDPFDAQFDFELLSGLGEPFEPGDDDF